MKELHDKHGIIGKVSNEAGRLLIELDCSKRIIEYQERMIIDNPTEHIVPLVIKRMNENVTLCYCYGNKVKLNDYLKSSTLNNKEALQIIKNIARSFIETSNILLNEESFYLSDESVYIDASNLAVGLIYLPIDYQADNKKALIDIVKKVYESCPDKNSYNQAEEKIVRNISQAGFTLKRFYCWLEEISERLEIIRKSETRLHIEDKEYKIAIPKNQVKAENKADFKINLNLKNKKIISLIIIQIILFGMIIALIIANRFDVGELCGIALMTGAIDVLLIKQLQKRWNTTE